MPKGSLKRETLIDVIAILPMAGNRRDMVEGFHDNGPWVGHYEVYCI